jgi:putative oxidoreductase
MVNTRFRTVSEFIAPLFIFLFTYTSVSKFLHIESFVATLRRSPLLNGNAVMIAWLIVFAEWIIVLLLLYHPLRFLGFIASLLIMFLFTIYIGYMIVSTPTLPCSCGGILQQLSWKNHLLLNTFLTILAGLGLYNEMKKLRSVKPSPV